MNVGKAIAAFERRLVSRAAPFDRFVEGLRTEDAAKLAALSPAAQRGAQLFVGKARCVLCHDGPNCTDREFHANRSPGGEEGVARLALITGLPVLPLNPVHGTESARLLAVIDEAWCIGCTLCIEACPVDAIAGASKQMHTVIASLCTGCELCLVLSSSMRIWS